MAKIEIIRRYYDQKKTAVKCGGLSKKKNYFIL